MDGAGRRARGVRRGRGRGGERRHAITRQRGARAGRVLKGQRRVGAAPGPSQEREINPAPGRAVCAARTGHSRHRCPERLRLPVCLWQCPRPGWAPGLGAAGAVGGVPAMGRAERSLPTQPSVIQRCIIGSVTPRCLGSLPVIPAGETPRISARDTTGRSGHVPALCPELCPGTPGAERGASCTHTSGRSRRRALSPPRPGAVLGDRDTGTVPGTRGRCQLPLRAGPRGARPGPVRAGLCRWLLLGSRSEWGKRHLEHKSHKTMESQTGAAGKGPYSPSSTPAMGDALGHFGVSSWRAQCAFPRGCVGLTSLYLPIPFKNAKPWVDFYG